VYFSYHIKEMPVVLIFGIATTIDSIHRSLPHRVTSLLSMEKFQAPSSSEYLSMVMRQVSNCVIACETIVLGERNRYYTASWLCNGYGIGW